MKARDFDYVKPSSLEEALTILRDRGETAQPLAGGQSLLPSLNMRLSSPQLLVDIGGLSALRGIAYKDGFVCIGALTRHVDIMHSETIATHVPLLSRAVYFVAHAAVRNRGTIGGSLALADPAAELPACMVALDATIVLAAATSKRAVRAREFFTGLFETDIRKGELICEIRVPAFRCTTRYAFSELSHRRGDFAIAGLAGVANLDEMDRVSDARLVYFGCSNYPTEAAAVAAGLLGHRIPIAESGWLDAAVQADLSPVNSPGLSAENKTKVATTLTRRLLESEWSDRRAQDFRKVRY
jgi:carbon-monoxide dehydrogenase medium subunit